MYCFWAINLNRMTFDLETFWHADTVDTGLVKFGGQGHTGRELELSNCRDARLCVTNKHRQLTKPNKSVFSFPRQLSTSHCPHLLLSAVLRSIIFSARRAFSSKPTTAACEWWNRRAERRTPGRYTNPALHTMRASAKNLALVYDKVSD